MNKEIWKPVVGFGGRYEVSNSGSVRAITRKSNGIYKIIRHPKRRKPRLNKYGYERINVFSEGRIITLMIHQVVARAFLPTPPPEMDCCNHKDGNKRNNSDTNLEWTQKTLNSTHASRIGLYKGGERNGRALITEEQAAEIFSLKGKMKAGHVMAKFGISRALLGGIWGGRNWQSRTSFMRIKPPQDLQIPAVELSAPSANVPFRERSDPNSQ